MSRPFAVTVHWFFVGGLKLETAAWPERADVSDRDKGQAAFLKLPTLFGAAMPSLYSLRPSGMILTDFRCLK
jgi:hypothetical protein